MTRPDQTEIEDLMRRYFGGLYHSDSQTLRTVFHADLSYVNGTSGIYEVMGLDDYMARIDARTPPSSRGDPRDDVIERIALKGDRIGIVEARMTMIGRNYQDLLTVINTDEGWRILTKVFSFVERKD
ncbi:nuclear transport factor 2 family protein [uncultured Ruegeria sp.]|uniref:nuclear transport factor 2 family protein n=1 Tax=uncultured Ruegeria sp. TaxID=259304 RepID=UPI002612B498|nr:nuclear transport factor 2 family protein [uncultured Ruegeria sp.]